MSVLKQHLQSAIFTLLERGVSQRKIHKLTGIDRKTILRYQALREAKRTEGTDSSTPPPRPPAPDGAPSSSFNFARSASEPHRE